MSDYEIQFVPRSEDYDPDAPVKRRKQERQGKPRAARENDIEARLYALNRRAVVDWQNRDAA